MRIVVCTYAGGLQALANHRLPTMGGDTMFCDALYACFAFLPDFKGSRRRVYDEELFLVALRHNPRYNGSMRDCKLDELTGGWWRTYGSPTIIRQICTCFHVPFPALKKTVAGQRGW